MADERIPPAVHQPYFRTGPLPVAWNRKKTKRSNASVPFVYVNPVDKLAELIKIKGAEPAELVQRIPLWHRIEKCIIGGNDAPLRKNLAKYIETHDQCEIYVGQDIWFKRPGSIDPVTGLRISESQRVVMWNSFTKTKITGSFAPTLRGLAEYLDTYPGIHVYRGQDLIENAVEECEESGLEDNKSSKKKNINESEVTLSPLQARLLKDVRNVGSKDSMKLPQTPTVGKQHSCRGNPINNMPSPGVRRKGKVDADYFDGLKANDSLEPNRIAIEDAAAAQKNSTSTQSTIIDLLFDIPETSNDMNAQKVGKEDSEIERSSSWSNLPLWTNRHAFHGPGHASSLISPFYAERSAVVYEDPIDWAIELGDSPMIDRNSKAFQSLLKEHAQVSLDYGCKPGVEQDEECILHDVNDCHQAVETDPSNYYLIADHESEK